MFCPSLQPPGLANPKLSAHGLSKRYGRFWAVKDVSLVLQAGEALGLLGPNGAGKSTTMLLLAGVLRPDAGHIEIVGERDPCRAAVRRHIGYAPQSIALYPELTARENLSLIARLYGLSHSTLTARVAQALELSMLTERADDKVHAFSGGMQRRLNLAAAIVHDPQLLLLDEPTVGVDPQSRSHIFSCIEALKQRGISIVYSTHYLEEAEHLCDTIAIMDGGSILAQGSPQELVRRYGGLAQVEAHMTAPPATPELRSHWREGRLSLGTEDPTRFIFQLLQESRDVTELSMRRPNLESVFMNLTGRTLRDG